MGTTTTNAQVRCFDVGEGTFVLAHTETQARLHYAEEAGLRLDSLDNPAIEVPRTAEIIDVDEPKCGERLTVGRCIDEHLMKGLAIPFTLAWRE